jgi:hypothetical protein
MSSRQAPSDVPYLERVINCNLTRLSRLLRILRFHAHELNLTASGTAYMRWGKGPKQRLRFTKTGEPKLEEAYATHLIWPGKGPFHLPAPKAAVGPPKCGACRHPAGAAYASGEQSSAMSWPTAIGREGISLRSSQGN